MVNLISLVLAKHVGETLTLPLASEIAREICPRTPLDPSLFSPSEYGEYTFQCEMLVGPAYAELQGQRRRYLAETMPGERNDLTDWDRLIDLQRCGDHVIFTARDRSGVMVGSLWLFLGFHIDTGRYHATDDLLYVHPDHRDGWLGVRLVQYGEGSTFAIGARSAVFDFRLENGAVRLARYLGYQPVSTRVVKVHDGEDFDAVPTRHMKGANG